MMVFGISANQLADIFYLNISAGTFWVMKFNLVSLKNTGTKVNIKNLVNENFY